MFRFCAQLFVWFCPSALLPSAAGGRSFAPALPFAAGKEQGTEKGIYTIPDRHGAVRRTACLSVLPCAGGEGLRARGSGGDGFLVCRGQGDDGLGRGRFAAPETFRNKVNVSFFKIL